jgi:hypothetical protein
MDIGFKRAIAGVMLVGLTVGAGAQAVTLTEPNAPLLPVSFGEWKQHPVGEVVQAYSLANVSKDALEECGPQRQDDPY